MKLEIMDFRSKKPSLLVLGFALALPLGAGEPALSATPSASKDRAAAAVRVATLVPFVERALDGLPANRVEVVASVRRTPTDAVGGVTDLGSPHAPSLEALAGARPDLIVTDTAMHAALAPRLEEIAPILQIDASSVDGTFEALHQVGRAVGMEDAMRVRIEDARKSIEAQRMSEPVETLALFGTPGSLLAITSRTWLGDLLGAMNLENLAADLTGRETVPGYVLVSDEILATMRPELIVVVAHGDPAAVQAALDARLGPGGAWGALTETASVHVLDAGRFAGNPGLGMAEVARHLHRLAEMP